MADLLFASATDHRLIDIGHVADFTNKALEALDSAGWDLAAPVLASLASGYTDAKRMEESNSWRYPWIWLQFSNMPSRSFLALSRLANAGATRESSPHWIASGF